MKYVNRPLLYGIASDVSVCLLHYFIFHVKYAELQIENIFVLFNVRSGEEATATTLTVAVKLKEKIYFYE